MEWELEIESEKQPVTIVPQQSQPVSPQRETVLVTAKGEDVTKWRKYASTYYTRSKTSKGEKTRKDNKETYQHYRDLLLAAGFGIEEGETTITIHEPNKEASA